MALLEKQPRGQGRPKIFFKILLRLYITKLKPTESTHEYAQEYCVNYYNYSNLKGYTVDMRTGFLTHK